MSSVLLVDDDETFRVRLAKAFSARGYEVEAAATVGEALEICKDFSPDLAVIDLKMPGESGLVLVEKLKEISSHTKILVLTGYASIATAVQAVKLGAKNYLQKPATLDMILGALAENIEPTSISAPTLTRVEWEHIQRVLGDCDGNVSQAAKILGMHRRSLQRKLTKNPPRV